MTYKETKNCDICRCNWFSRIETNDPYVLNIKTCPICRKQFDLLQINEGLLYKPQVTRKTRTETLLHNSTIGCTGKKI